MSAFKDGRKNYVFKIDTRDILKLHIIFLKGVFAAYSPERYS